MSYARTEKNIGGKQNFHSSLQAKRAFRMQHAAVGAVLTPLAQRVELGLDGRSCRLVIGTLRVLQLHHEAAWETRVLELAQPLDG